MRIFPRIARSFWIPATARDHPSHAGRNRVTRVFQKPVFPKRVCPSLTACVSILFTPRAHGSLSRPPWDTWPVPNIAGNSSKYGFREKVSAVTRSGPLFRILNLAGSLTTGGMRLHGSGPASFTRARGGESCMRGFFPAGLRPRLPNGHLMIFSSMRTSDFCAKKRRQNWSDSGKRMKNCMLLWSEKVFRAGLRQKWQKKRKKRKINVEQWHFLGYSKRGII